MDEQQPIPVCSYCKSPMRLVGVEPHPARPNREVYTFECTGCARIEATPERPH